MPSECNLLQYMHLMKCPRCGFEQPEDRYCANCGADVQKLKARPTPFLIRLLQNPNFHLSLIGVLIALVVFYILYSQSELVSREVRTLLDLPISSKEAASPDEFAAESAAIQDQAEEPPASSETPLESSEAVESDQQKVEAATTEIKTPVAKNLEMTIHEVPRDTLLAIVQVGEKVAESTAGRAFYFPQGQNISEALTKASRKLGTTRQTPLQPGANFELETPSTSPEAFQFALFLQQSKWDGNEGQIRFDLNLVLPQPENSAEASVPAIRQVIEAGLSGSSTLNPSGLLLILIDPPNRNPRSEFLTKAGEGPWSIFQSDDFRAGVSDWIVLVQPK